MSNHCLYCTCANTIMFVVLIPSSVRKFSSGDSQDVTAFRPPEELVKKWQLPFQPSIRDSIVH